jgi:hypothetical protein
LQRLGDASVDLTVIAQFFSLLDLALDQQRRTHMAITIAAAIGALETQALCCRQDRFTR